MFKAKKVIPTLATGALTLAGCGGDGGGGLSGAINNVCSKFQECFPQEFSEFFDSVKECTDYYSDYYSGYSGACESAIISYFNCYASQSCEEIMQGSDRCDDEFDTLLVACAE